MKLPSDDHIQTALLWLRSNEGEGEEKEACEAVADWLETFAQNDWLRRAARDAGVAYRKTFHRRQDCR